jgi:hypothetical protein
MTARAMPVRRAAWVLFGPIVWALHFLLVYASESLLCRLLDGGSHTLLLAGATVVAIIALIWDLWLRRRLTPGDDVAHFMTRARVALDALALLAIVMVAVAGLALPSCR